MSISSNYASYAVKMRGMVAAGVDLEVDARFIDMLVGRRARVLDIGCGIGSAVNALRQRGHDAYGVDPSRSVLDVANDLFDPSWYRQLSADQISETSLREQGLPAEYDCVLMAGNVPAFLPPSTLQTTFELTAALLTPAGFLVTGTSTGSPGGPQDQDTAAQTANLTLRHRFSNWHLAPFNDRPWCVSVYTSPGLRAAVDGPDGIFILPS